MEENSKKSIFLKIPKLIIIIAIVVLVATIGVAVYFTTFHCKHNYDAATTVEPTCIQDGEKEYTCKKCKKSYTKKIPKDAIFHDYEFAVTRETTCTEDGEMTFTCKYCQKSYTKPISAQHEWIPATCAKPKTCSVCGVTIGEKSNSHKFENGICKVCGYDTYKRVVYSGVTFRIPKEKITLSYCGDLFVMTDVNVKYEKSSSGYSYFYVYYGGEKTEGDGTMYFKYSLKDSDGYVISSGTELAPNLNNGEKTRDATFTISLNHVDGTDLRDGGVYTLSIESYK